MAQHVGSFAGIHLPGLVHVLAKIFRHLLYTSEMLIRQLLGIIIHC